MMIFGICFVLYVIKLSAGKGLLSQFALSFTQRHENRATRPHINLDVYFLTFRLRRIRQCSFGLLNNFGRSTTSQTTMEILSEESKLITTHKKDERSLLKRIFIKTRQKATGLVKITLNFA